MLTQSTRGRARWGEARLGRRCELVDDEQQTTRLAVVQAFDCLCRGVAALHDDGPEGLAERGGDRGFRTRFDLEQVDQRADDAVDSGELVATGRSACRTEAEIERVGAGAPSRRLGLGRAPRLVGLAQRRLRARDVAVVGGRSSGDRFVELGELAPQHAGIGHERLQHTGIGRGRELALDAPKLLGHQRGQAPCALARRLDAHEPVGEGVVAHHGERALGVEHADVEIAETDPQLGLALRVLCTRIAQPFDPRLQAGDLVPGEMQPDRA